MSEIETIGRLKREREMLAEGIADVAKAAGIIDGKQPLTGPQLLLLCDNLRDHFEGEPPHVELLKQLQQVIQAGIFGIPATEVIKWNGKIQEVIEQGTNPQPPNVTT